MSGVNAAFYGEVVNPLTSIDAPDGGEGAAGIAGVIETSGGVETLTVGTVSLGGKSAAGFSLENLNLPGFPLIDVLVTVKITSAGITSTLDTFTWAPAVTAFVQSYRPIVGETLTVTLTTAAGQVNGARMMGAVYASSF